MEETDEQAPFPREPWQRLLEDPADGPPETTDARIRAAARRDLAPRGRRWWLPASLAASFVLAVFIVQSQFGTLRVPVRTESEGGAGGAMDARIIEREEAPENRAPGESPSAASQSKAPARGAPQLEEYGYDDSELAADSAGAGPRIGGPERDLQAATEVPEEAIAASPSAETPAAADAKSGFAAEPARQAPAAAAAYSEARARLRSPEDWYAAIEKLRAEGRIEEADQELERLEKAYPGWLKKHLEKRSHR